MYGLDLFSGIGGLTKALEGYVEPLAYCENDRYAQSVLLSRMGSGDLPRAPIWDDVRTLKSEMLPAIDIIYGGFPCQDISVAGRGEGLGGERSGLFFEIVRLVSEIQPRFIFLENVSAITVRGAERVIGEFCRLRYDCRWGILSASDVGANHQRERWWLLAHAQGDGRIGGSGEAAGSGCLGIKREAISIKRVGESISDASSQRTGSIPTRSGDKGKGTSDLDGHREDVADSKSARPISRGSGSGQEKAYPEPIERSHIQDSASHGREKQGNYRISKGKTNPTTDPGWWTVEPDVGGTLDGFSSWLDGYDMTDSHKLLLTYGKANNQNYSKVLSVLRKSIRTQDDRRSNGRSICVFPQEVLLAYVCQLSKASKALGDVSLASPETQEEILRSLRLDKKFARPPLRWDAIKQRPEKHPNTLHLLSSILAFHAEKAWSTYRRETPQHFYWESGIARTSTKVPFRVDRLRCLGNAVVPTQAREAFERLLGLK